MISNQSVAFRAFGALVVGLSLVGLFACSQKSSPPPPDPTRFDARMNAFDEMDRTNPPAANPIVFVGSSSIRLWPTDTQFPDLPVINRGFGGSHISDVNYHVERVVLRYDPSIVVFYAGDNDVADGKSPEKVLRDFEAFASRVRSECRNTRVMFLSIKPSASRWGAWPRMKEANEKIEAFAASDSMITYVDVASGLLGPDGLPNASLYVDDELHLSPSGYDLWYGILSPILEEAYGAGDVESSCSAVQVE